MQRRRETTHDDESRSGETKLQASGARPEGVKRNGAHQMPAGNVIGESRPCARRTGPTRRMIHACTWLGRPPSQSVNNIRSRKRNFDPIVFAEYVVQYPSSCTYTMLYNKLAHGSWVKSA